MKLKFELMAQVLADYLDLPFLLLVTTGLGHWDSNPRPPSYLPAGLAPFSTNMTFGERVGNLILKVPSSFCFFVYIN